MSKLWKRLASAGPGALALLAAAPVIAADLAYPPYPGDEPSPSRIYREERVEEALPPPPPPRPYFTSRFGADLYAASPAFAEACRTIVKRRIDEDGEEIERRIRICDGPVHPPGPRLRPSFYHAPPLPSADVPYGDRPGPGW